MYLHISNESQLPDLSGIGPHKTVVIVEDEVDESRQTELSEWMVASGCLYMMAWGKDCSSWDTSVDIANIEQFDYKDIPEEQFVMTTWHENEPLQEVFWYAKNLAFHPVKDLSETVLLHLSTEEQPGLQQRFDSA